MVEPNAVVVAVREMTAATNALAGRVGVTERIVRHQRRQGERMRWYLAALVLVVVLGAGGTLWAAHRAAHGNCVAVNRTRAAEVFFWTDLIRKFQPHPTGVQARQQHDFFVVLHRDFPQRDC